MKVENESATKGKSIADILPLTNDAIVLSEAMKSIADHFGLPFDTGCTGARILKLTSFFRWLSDSKCSVSIMEAIADFYRYNQITIQAHN